MISDRPPAWEFTARETLLLCTATRRLRYPNSAWPGFGHKDDELDELLDRLYAYLTARQKWERLYLPREDEVPF